MSLIFFSYSLFLVCFQFIECHSDDYNISLGDLMKNKLKLSDRPYAVYKPISLNEDKKLTPLNLSEAAKPFMLLYGNKPEYIFRIALKAEDVNILGVDARGSLQNG